VSPSGHCGAKVHKAVFLASLSSFIAGIDPFGFNGILPFQVSRSFFVVSLTCLGMCFLFLAQKPVITLVSVSPQGGSVSVPRALLWCWKIAECFLYVAIVWALLFTHNPLGLDPETQPVKELSFVGSIFVAVSLWFLLIPSIFALGMVLYEIHHLEKALQDTTNIDYQVVKRRLLTVALLLFSFFLATIFIVIPRDQPIETPCESGCLIARDSYPWVKFPPVFCRFIFLVVFVRRAWMPYEKFQARISMSTEILQPNKKGRGDLAVFPVAASKSRTQSGVFK
jgi:hypothetical protein